MKWKVLGLRTLHGFGEVVSSVVALLVVLAVFGGAAYGVWYGLGFILQTPSDRINATLAVATVTLGSITVWATWLSHRETRNAREYETHVSLRPRVTVQPADTDLAIRPQGVLLDNPPPKPSGEVSLFLDFRGGNRKSVSPEDTQSRFALQVHNAGRGAAHGLRVVRVSPSCQVEQTPSEFLVGSGADVELAVDAVGPAGRDVTIWFQYMDSMGYDHALEVRFEHYHMVPIAISSTVMERWIVKRYAKL